jgi:hypothetical protein
MNQASFGNTIDDSCELNSMVPVHELREPSIAANTTSPEQQNLSVHLPRLGEVLSNSIESPTRQIHQANTLALITQQTRLHHQHTQNGVHGGFAPLDPYFDSIVLEDSDLDYWVRLAEGPGYPVNSQLSDSTSNHAAEMSCDGAATGLTESLPHEGVLWAGEPHMSNSRPGMEGGEMESIIEPIDGAMELDTIVEKRTPDNKATIELSSRQGRLQIAEDGQLRYYGATSNMHILHHGPDAISRPHIRRIETHGKEAIAKANLDWPGESSYEEHLIGLFFAWYNPFMNVVDNRAYYQARQLHADGKPSPLYSLCLTNAM